jgi:hypothetical protein
MHKFSSLLIGFICLGIAGCSSKFAQSPDEALPKDWTPSAVNMPLLGSGEHALETRILVWMIAEDDRPLYIEQAIVLLHFDNGVKPRWALAHLYRHPHDPASPGWQLPKRWHAPRFVPRRDFDHAPSNEAIAEFLRDSEWEFEPSIGFRLLGGSVCQKTWTAAIGEKPPDAYKVIPHQPKPGEWRLDFP